MSAIAEIASPIAYLLSSLLEYLPPLWLRLAIGLGIFAALAAVDLFRHGQAATRWREYTFLLVSVGVALAYGILNDQLTVSFSPEYFAYGKGLADTLGPHFDQQPLALRWESAKVGMQATWSVGLLIGVAMLLANNPSPELPRLPLKTLVGLFPRLLVYCLCCATSLGIAGYMGWLAWFSDDFAEMLHRDQFRPRRFMAVYGIHLGGYIGGLVGTALAVVSIRCRRALRPNHVTDTSSLGLPT